MTYFLLLTAFTVSIDSLVCGFSLSLMGKKKFFIVIGIALTVYAMCFLANYLALFLKDCLTEKTAGFGGIILIGVGVFNLIKRDDCASVSDKNIISRTLLTGFAVGLDGAAANLSLALMGINAFYVPLVIAAMHALMIATGIALAQTPLVKKLDGFSFIPPAVLILLGAYKLVSVF